MSYHPVSKKAGAAPTAPGPLDTKVAHSVSPDNRELASSPEEITAKLAPMADDVNSSGEAIGGTELVVQSSTPMKTRAIGVSKSRRDWKELIQSGSLGVVRWDEFRLANVVERNGRREDLTAQNITRLLHACEAQGCSNISRRRFEQYLEMVAEDNPCDSALEMLASLPSWDKKPRVENLLSTYLGTKSGPFERAVGRYWLTAMVARLVEPGCKADLLPILVGDRRTGKSTLLRHIVPSQNFWTEACLADQPKQLTQKVIGRAQVVWKELAGIKNKTDIDRVTAFISNPVIELNSRLHPGMDHYQRRFILVGTSSKKYFLRDADGHGQYLPFETGKIDLNRLKKDILQIWAEALHIVRQRQASGLSLVDYEDAQRLAQYEYYKYMHNSFQNGSVSFGRDDDLLREIRKIGNHFKTDDALIACGFGSQLGKENKNKMANFLRHHGYRYAQKTVHGVRSKVWHCPGQIPNRNEAMDCC